VHQRSESLLSGVVRLARPKIFAMTTRPTPHSLSAGRLVFIRALRALAQELLLHADVLERGA